jgi:hypothetical protein
MLYSPVVLGVDVYPTGIFLRDHHEMTRTVMHIILSRRQVGWAPSNLSTNLRLEILFDWTGNPMNPMNATTLIQLLTSIVAQLVTHDSDVAWLNVSCRAVTILCESDECEKPADACDARCGTIPNQTILGYMAASYNLRQ